MGAAEEIGSVMMTGRLDVISDGIGILIVIVGRVDEKPEEGMIKFNLWAQVSGFSPCGNVLVLIGDIGRTRKERRPTS